MKKILALLLALVMVFALAACGNDNTGSDDDKKPEKKGLEDTWSWTVVAGGEQMGIDDFNGEFSMTINFEFDDGKFTMALDEKAMEKSIDAFAEDLVDYMVELGADRDESEEYVEEMDLYEMFKESMEDMTSSGTYTTEGDKLTLTNEDDETISYTYKLDGDKLTLEPESEDEQEMLEAFDLDAMELTRVG